MNTCTANTYKTPKSEGYCYKDGVQTGSEGFSYLESALTYNNGFTMDYSYEFDRSYGDEYGYVQAKNANGTDKSKKLSFVGNGGIKYGGTSGSFEAAILDVKAMVAMILGDSAVVNQTELTQEQITALAGKIVESEAAKGNLKVGGYDKEPITKLLDAVGYGSSLDSAYDALYVEIESTAQGTEKKNAILASFLAGVFKMTPAGQTVRLEMITPIDAYNNSIRITANDKTYCYLERFPCTSTTDEFTGKIYLQSHWGSGVEYVVSSIVCQKSPLEE